MMNVLDLIALIIAVGAIIVALKVFSRRRVLNFFLDPLRYATDIALGLPLALLLSTNSFLVLMYGAIGKTGNSVVTGAFYLTNLAIIFYTSLRPFSLRPADYLFLTFLASILGSTIFHGSSASARDWILLALSLFGYPAFRMIRGEFKQTFLAVTGLIVLIGTIATAWQLIFFSDLRSKPLVFGFSDAAPANFLMSLTFLIFAFISADLSFRRAVKFAVVIFVPVAIFAASMVRFTFMAIVASLLVSAIGYRSGRQNVFVITAAVALAILTGLSSRPEATARFTKYLQARDTSVSTVTASPALPLESPSAVASSANSSEPSQLTTSTKEMRGIAATVAPLNEKQPATASSANSPEPSQSPPSATEMPAIAAPIDPSEEKRPTIASSANSPESSQTTPSAKEVPVIIAPAAPSNENQFAIASEASPSRPLRPEASLPKVAPPEIKNEVTSSKPLTKEDYTIPQQSAQPQLPPSCILVIDQADSIAMRKLLLSDAAFFISHQGILGEGFRSFSKASCLRMDPHNSILEAATDFGVLGAGCLIGMIIFALAGLFPLIRKDNNSRFVFAGLVFMFLISMAHGHLAGDMLLFSFIGWAVGVKDEYDRLETAKDIPWNLPGGNIQNKKLSEKA